MCPCLLGELGVYLRRAGHATAVPAAVPQPWEAALAGRRREAASAWAALGERYEQAVELASANDSTGLAMLDELGASATIKALARRD